MIFIGDSWRAEEEAGGFKDQMSGEHIAEPLRSRVSFSNYVKMQLLRGFL